MTKRMGMLAVAALAVLVPGGAVAGCSCDIDCSAPMVDVTVFTDIAKLELCDTLAPCITETFTEAGQGIERRTVTMTIPQAASWQVRAYAFDGSVMVDQTIVPKFEHPGSCDCADNVELFVTADGASQTNA